MNKIQFATSRIIDSKGDFLTLCLLKEKLERKSGQREEGRTQVQVSETLRVGLHCGLCTERMRHKAKGLCHNNIDNCDAIGGGREAASTRARETMRARTFGSKNSSKYE